MGKEIEYGKEVIKKPLIIINIQVLSHTFVLVHF